MQKVKKKKKQQQQKLSLYWKKVRTKLLVFEHSRRNENENDTTDLRSFSKISCACLNRVLIKLLITIARNSASIEMCSGSFRCL